MSRQINPMVTRKIKKDVKYDGIGGKDILIEMELPSSEVDITRNWACINFVVRRPDIPIGSNLKCYYGHVDNLGYIVAEDELED